MITNITKWLVGVTGGIAAYKTPEIVRLLKKQGCEVRVVMSSSAKAFVTPMTLQAVSGNPVYSELLDTDFEAAMGHIELARWAQGILIAPLSANRLAALALGMADDLLTTLCLATQAPIWAAPAMNQKMWHHPATQHNIETLKMRGVTLLGPDWGEQACGDIGLGRMLEPQDIVNQLSPQTGFLKDVNLLISAGPTIEAIDPVRFISNKSSGKMGFALAKAAHDQGAKVTLVAGPVSLPTPIGVERIDVISAQEMYEAVIAKSRTADIFISAAAVSDFRPKVCADQKIKKNHHADLHLELIKNPDILATVAKSPQRPFCVGFAAESEHCEEYAKNKLKEKELDLIAMNNISISGIGFDADHNALTVFSAEREYHLPKNSKYNIALALLKIISEQIYAKNKT